jgi:hypothetical protein
MVYHCFANKNIQFYPDFAPFFSRNLLKEWSCRHYAQLLVSKHHVDALYFLDDCLREYDTCR